MAQGPDAVRQSIDATLAKLQTLYLDLVLLHWPVPGKFVEAYRALQEAHASGKVQALGLSNFTMTDYQELVDSGVVTVPPICNQMEVSPAMYRPEVIRFYQEQHDMVVIAFKPLQRGALLQQPDEPYRSMAQRYKVSVAQLLIRWALQHNLVVATKTSTAARMAENRNVWHFELSAQDMETLDGLTTAEAIQQRAERERASKLV